MSKAWAENIKKLESTEKVAGCIFYCQGHRKKKQKKTLSQVTVLSISHKNSEDGVVKSASACQYYKQVKLSFKKNKKMMVWCLHPFQQYLSHTEKMEGW